MASDSIPIVHRHLALMLCDSAAVLEETLAQIEFSEIPHQRLGDRALVAPAVEVEKIRERLHGKGIYPRVVGDVIRPEMLEEEAAEESDEENVQEEES